MVDTAAVAVSEWDVVLCLLTFLTRCFLEIEGRSEVCFLFQAQSPLSNVDCGWSSVDGWTPFQFGLSARVADVGFSESSAFLSDVPACASIR
jgi:hypothetical protein